MLKCAQCPETFETDNERRKHRVEAHQDSTILKYKFNNTITKKIRKLDDQFECLCSKTFAKAEGLQKHWNGNCRKNSATIPCHRTPYPPHFA
jgi:hypothetical protein